MDVSKRQIQLTGRFLEIAKRYTSDGWIEHLLWETIEGTRDRPFPLMDPLLPGEMESLRALRDEIKIWFFWQNGKWNPVAVDVWRPYAEKRTAKVVLDELHTGVTT